MFGSEKSTLNNNNKNTNFHVTTYEVLLCQPSVTGTRMREDCIIYGTCTTAQRNCTTGQQSLLSCMNSRNEQFMMPTLK
jgi:hypothetical protein